MKDCTAGVVGFTNFILILRGWDLCNTFETHGFSFLGTFSSKVHKKLGKSWEIPLKSGNWKSYKSNNLLFSFKWKEGNTRQHCRKQGGFNAHGDAR